MYFCLFHTFLSLFHRLVDISSYKIVATPPETSSLDSLSIAGTRTFRIEEVPTDQLHLAEDEMLVPVAHFQKEVFSTFGFPFLVKVKQGELFSHVRERIQKRLDVPDKEYEKVSNSVNCSYLRYQVVWLVYVKFGLT